MSVEKDKAPSPRAYLLGTLSDEEGVHLEEEFFSDDKTFEEIEIAEDELIDDYLRDDLTRAERDQFQKHLLGNSRITERVKFAELLQQASKSAGQRKSIKPEPVSWWSSLIAFFSTPQRLGGAFAVLAVVIAGGFLFADWLRLRDESRRLVAERAELQRQYNSLEGQLQTEKRQMNDERQSVEALSTRLDEALNNLPDRSDAVALLTPLFLFPGGSRGSGGSNDVILPSRLSIVRLQLALESNDYPHYTAVVSRAEGPVAFRKTNLKPATKQSLAVIDLRFPSTVLTNGDYIVNVDGVRPGNSSFVATYNFRAVSR